MISRSFPGVALWMLNHSEVRELTVTTFMELI